MTRRQRNPKAWVVVVKDQEYIDADGIHKVKHYACADCLEGGYNILRGWTEDVGTVLLVNTKAEAEATAREWNEDFRRNGTFMDD